MATVLVVDDERNMRLLTAARLDGQYKVLTAKDGEEALEIIHKGGVDLVVADIMMPHMDGYELLRKLRDEGYSMPFLFLTAKESLEDKERGFSLGTDDYITKPFSSDELLWRIKALLRRAEIAESRKIRIGSVTVDSEKYAVYSDTEYVFFQANSNSYATLLIKDRGNVNITVAENAAQIITSLSWPAIVFAFVI